MAKFYSIQTLDDGSSLNPSPEEQNRARFEPQPVSFSGRCRSSQRLRAAVHVGQLQVRDGQLEVRHDLHLQHSHEPDRPGAAVRGRVPGLLPPAEIHHELAAVTG